MATQTGQFALVFSRDPSSAEIFKFNEFEDPKGVFEVGAIRRVKQRSWKECPGTILCIGTRVALNRIKVDSNGVMNDSLPKEEAIQNRFQELAKEKKMLAQSQAAKEKHMRELNARLLANGPDGLPSSSKTANPKKKTQKRKATPEERALLDEQLKALPYKQKKIGDWQLSAGDDVYVKGSALLAHTKCYCKAPSLLFRSILDEIIPREISSNPALTRAGGNDTVALPKDIYLAINVYVMNTCKENNIEATYDLHKLVTNYIEHRQDPDRKKTNGTEEEEESVEADDSSEESNRNYSTDDSTIMTDNIINETATTEEVNRDRSEAGTITVNAVSVDWDPTQINLNQNVTTEQGTIITESDTLKTYRSI